MKFGIAEIIPAFTVISTMMTACACTNATNEKVGMQPNSEPANAPPSSSSSLLGSNPSSLNVLPSNESQLMSSQEIAPSQQHASDDNNGGAKKIEMGSVLVIGKKENGLGDINWAINIMNELKVMSTAKVTCLFYGLWDGTKEYLEKRSDFRDVVIVDSIKKVEAVDRRCYFRTNSNDIRDDGLEILLKSMIILCSSTQVLQLILGLI